MTTLTHHFDMHDTQQKTCILQTNNNLQNKAKWIH